jgi:hypothetical protein
MSQVMRIIFLALLVTVSALAADIAASVGIGPSTSSVNVGNGAFSGASSTATVLIDGSVKAFGIGPASILLDVPLAIGGPSNAQVSASNTGVVAYADHMQFAITPGLKGRFNLGLIAPWVSFGVGGARLDQAATYIPPYTAATAQTSNKWSFVLSPAGGIDIKPLPFLFFRGEVRSYVYRTPEQLLTTGINPFKGNWQSNLVFLAGVGLRF